MRTEKYVSKYKETVNDMNELYRLCLRAYMLKDCRSEYLWAFEQALDLNCDAPLLENPRYFRVTRKYPLPEKGYTSIQKFRLYMMLYAYVMRDSGLLNKESPSEADGVVDAAFGGRAWPSTASSWTTTRGRCSSPGRCWSHMECAGEGRPTAR